jgi:endonuclease/exonuclease/phosphatase family metal-dependent hydrolase
MVLGAAGSSGASEPPPVGGPVTTPTAQLTVLDANVAEYLNTKDNQQRQDLTNFAKRAALVLAAQQEAGRPVHAPDLVFLQEVNAATARAVAVRLSSRLGQNYAVAGNRATGPAGGNGAVVRHRSAKHPLLTRATAVLYNTATMNPPSAARLITFSYPKAQMWAKRHCPAGSRTCTANMWEARQTAMFRFTAKATGEVYAVASVHFVPSLFLRPRMTSDQQPGFRQARWITLLQRTITATYPGATQILAGDFNTYLCGDDSAHLGQPLCDQPSQYTALLRAALARPGYSAVIDSGIDHMFTTGSVLASGKDTTYKLYAATNAGRVRTAAEYLSAADYASRFADAADYNRCDALYDAGRASAAAADAIPGCRGRYYSDHPLDWAVVG